MNCINQFLIAMVIIHGVMAKPANLPNERLTSYEGLDRRYRETPCSHEDEICAWALYENMTWNLIQYVINCTCKTGMVCAKDEDKMMARQYIYRCLLDPVSNETTTFEPSTTLAPTALSGQ